MQLYEVTAEEYAQAGFYAHVYNTPEFSELKDVYKRQGMTTAGCAGCTLHKQVTDKE